MNEQNDTEPEGTQRWVKVFASQYHKGHEYEELKPYKECERCGKYKLTTRRRTETRSCIIGVEMFYWEYCKNCEYVSEKTRREYDD